MTNHRLHADTTKTLTVRELIELLQQFPPEAEVYTEGCDCIGTVGSIMQDADGTLLLTRVPEK